MIKHPSRNRCPVALIYAGRRSTGHEPSIAFLSILILAVFVGLSVNVGEARQHATVAGGGSHGLGIRVDGTVVACHEKVLVLNENYGELKQLLQDALDDALLMGCSKAMVLAAFQAALDGVQATVQEDDMAV